jgi:hypothetical protein
VAAVVHGLGHHPAGRRHRRQQRQPLDRHPPGSGRCGRSKRSLAAGDERGGGGQLGVDRERLAAALDVPPGGGADDGDAQRSPRSRSAGRRSQGGPGARRLRSGTPPARLSRSAGASRSATPLVARAPRIPRPMVTPGPAPTEASTTAPRHPAPPPSPGEPPSRPPPDSAPGPPEAPAPPTHLREASRSLAAWHQSPHPRTGTPRHVLARARSSGHRRNRKLSRRPPTIPAGQGPRRSHKGLRNKLRRAG